MSGAAGRQLYIMEHLDIDTLSSLQGHLARLTGLYLSLHGERGNLIIPPVNENKLLSSLRALPEGRDAYQDFVKNNIEKALQRTDISFFKGPGELSYFFMPIRIEVSAFIVVGGGVYVSAADRDTFFNTAGIAFGFTSDQRRALLQDMSVKDYAEFQDTARYICSIYGIGLQNSCRGTFLEKRYRIIKTVFSLISEIEPEKQVNEIYDLIMDMILFLFNAESMAVMIRDNNVFIPRKSAGKCRDYLSTISLETTGILSEVVEKQKPLYSESVMDILRFGFNEKISSMYVFPIISDDKATGLFIIYNSVISQEDADIIFELCKMIGSTLRIAEIQETYHKCLKEIEILNTAATRLIPVKEPDMLYETILDMSVSLAEAEKGSLMLVSEDAACLTVKAAKGINRRLLTDIRIRAGEGIAGWVFREGTPLVMDDIEKNEWGFPKRHKYRTGSFISIPLKLGEKTIGVLNMSDKISGEVFSSEDMALISSFAAYATIALERSTYYILAGHLKELSITDSLTGLFNRRYFEERFFEELNRSDRHNLSFSLSMIDIDDFKLFNDSEGHLAGDEILRSIANIAKDCLRVSDVIARFGGEEFAVIMPQTEREEAILVSERIRKSIKEQIPVTWNVFPRKSISVSIGIATFPYDGKERKELIRNADKALYMAKMEGKDRTVLWHSKG
jgi:diguanylate cyclase (GGDEF)-like protein